LISRVKYIPSCTPIYQPRSSHDCFASRLEYVSKKEKEIDGREEEEGPGLTLYTIFANIHSTSSTSTSTPCNWRASWNVDMGIRVDLSEAIHLFISLGSNSSLHAMSFSSRVDEAFIDKVFPLSHLIIGRRVDLSSLPLAPRSSPFYTHSSHSSVSVRRLVPRKVLPPFYARSKDLRLFKQYPQTPLPSPLNHQVDITSNKSRLSPFKPFIIFPNITRLNCSNKGSEKLLESRMGG
jgi:hypothetical protein